MTDRIELRGLRVVAVHGVLAEERDRAQPFEVDLDLSVDLSVPGRSDDLADTVDYGALCDAVAAALGPPSAQLLEHLAQRAADAALDAAGRHGRAVTVTVRKLRPPVPLDLAAAAVTVTRSRPSPPAAPPPAAPPAAPPPAAPPPARPPAAAQRP